MEPLQVDIEYDADHFYVFVMFKSSVKKEKYEECIFNQASGGSSQMSWMIWDTFKGDRCQEKTH